MLVMRTIIGVSVLALLGACSGAGEDATVPQAMPAGETEADIGDFVVHFNAQNTEQLPPEVARAYNIVRSKNRAMLTVSIIDKATGDSVSGDVAVKTQNLTGQLKNVQMRRIEEQEAIYYIGETAVANRETLIFDISVKPQGRPSASDVRFMREFYTD